MLTNWSGIKKCPLLHNGLKIINRNKITTITELSLFSEHDTANVFFMHYFDEYIFFSYKKGLLFKFVSLRLTYGVIRELNCDLRSCSINQIVYSPNVSIVGKITLRFYRNMKFCISQPWFLVITQKLPQVFSCHKPQDKTQYWHWCLQKTKNIIGLTPAL